MTKEFVESISDSMFTTAVAVSIPNDYKDIDDNKIQLWLYTRSLESGEAMSFIYLKNVFKDLGINTKDKKSFDEFLMTTYKRFNSIPALFSYYSYCEKIIMFYNTTNNLLDLYRLHQRNQNIDIIKSKAKQAVEEIVTEEDKYLKE